MIYYVNYQPSACMARVAQHALLNHAMTAALIDHTSRLAPNSQRTRVGMTV